jgi:hypothetical protein
VPELNDLESGLAALAAEIAWPATPNLGPAVTRQIATTAPRWYERRLVMAAAAAVVIMALLLAYTPTRDAIAGFLNLHTTVNRVNVLPTPSPLQPGPLGQRLGLGQRVTLATARASVTWPVVLPAGLGEPDEVYLSSPTLGPTGGEVTLVYAARPGIPVAGETGVSLLVTEARGSVDEQFFGKMIGGGTTIEDVTVNGHRGWWIAGAPHIFLFIGTDGVVRDETMRLATNTLVLDVGGTIVRMEGNLTKQQALNLGASLS